MNDFVDQMKSVVGRTVKSVKVDPKTGHTMLEFEDSSLNTKLTFNIRSIGFVGSQTVPAKKPVNAKLKAKEAALADETKKRVRKKPVKGKTTPL